MDVKIKKGCDLKISGEAAKEIADFQSDKVAYSLADFKYLKPKVLVNEGDVVKAGQTLFIDKKDDRVTFVSPVAGVVEEIRRGDRRVLLNVIIRKEGDDKVEFPVLDASAVSGLDADAAKEALYSRGLWPCIQRRPYHKVAEIADAPTAIYVNCLDSNPLAADPNFYLQDRLEDFKLGIELLKKISSNIHLCLDGNQANIFQAEGTNQHSFSGVHPRGNLSVHIDSIDPIHDINKVIWSVRAQEVAAIGKTLSTGSFDAERTIAYAGPAAEAPKYYKTTLGASTQALPTKEGEVRKVSGSALQGRGLGEEAYLGFYDNTITALSEDREQKILGWLTPGFKSHSFTGCYATAVKPQESYDLTTSTNGEHRAIVDSEMFDKVQPLDIHTIFLYKSLLVEDIEEAERLGLWSVAPEDFALATYMDPSKNDFSAPLEKVLGMLYKEDN